MKTVGKVLATFGIIVGLVIGRDMARAIGGSPLIFGGMIAFAIWGLYALWRRSPHF